MRDWVAGKATKMADEAYAAVYTAEAPDDDPVADRIWEETYANWIERCELFYAEMDATEQAEFDALPMRQKLAQVY